ncbi:MAG: type II secretion system F family protein [Magnetococcus sp. XQGC-1]
MPSFRFKSMNAQGRVVRGQMDADNVNDLEARLRRMDLDIIRFQEVSRRGGRFFGRRISRQEMITFCFHLEQVMESGVPLLAGIRDLRDSTDNPVMQTLLGAMIEEITMGKTLSHVMEGFPEVFDAVFIALIRAGEQTGNLRIIFMNLADALKWQDELASKTRKMLMYPMFVGTIVLGVFSFMMIFLVPQLVTFIKMMGVDLPLHTRLLVGLSKLVTHYWPVVVGVPVGFFFLFLFLFRVSPAVRYGWDWVKLHVWIFGPIVKKMVMARFANVFAIMYGAGITVLDCLVISEKVVGNRVIGRVMREVRDRIRDGETIGESFKKTMVFPPLVLRMLSVGETTGALDKSLNSVCYFYDRDVKDSVDRLQGMIEPLLTLILGGFMAWIVLSVLGPIYSIMGGVGH